MSLLICLLAFSEITLDNGLSLHYVKEGSGPPIVMITGFGASLEGWQPTSDLLKEHFTVLRLDNRGIGGSGDLEGPYTVDTMGADAAALMAALGYETYHVCGISLGSFAAQALALQFPDRVDKLVLIGSSPGGKVHVAADAEVMTYWQTRGSMEPEARAHKGLTLSTHPSWPENNKEEYEKWVAFSASRKTNPSAVMRQSFAAIAFDHAEKAKQITAETLILHGDSDRLVPLANAEKLHTLIPDSTLVILKMTGHIPIIERPEQTANAIMDFLKP